MHWRGWEHLLQPKDRGGLGFRDFRMFNQALLAHQAWRLLKKPESLCAQVLKARYYPMGNLEDTVSPGNASPTWQAICHGLDLLKKGLLWRVGDGASIRVWRIAGSRDRFLINRSPPKAAAVSGLFLVY